MKKILKYTISLLIISMLIPSISVFATDGNSVDTVFFGNVQDDGTGCSVYTILFLLIDIFSGMVGILGVIGIAIAGITYITAKGDEAKVTIAKRRLFEIVLGLAFFAVLQVGLRFLLPAINTDIHACSSAGTNESSGNQSTNPNPTPSGDSKPDTSNPTTNTKQSKVSSSTKIKKVSGNGFSQTITLDGKTYKLYKQYAGSYASNRFSHNVNSLNGKISNTGCGPASLAIILSGYGFKSNPGDVATGLIKAAKQVGRNDPTNTGSIGQFLKNNNMKSKNHSNSDSYNVTYNNMKQALLQGRQIFIYVGSGNADKKIWSQFTRSGNHFISVLAIDSSNDKVFVGNPGGKKSGWFSLEEVVKSRKPRQFWREIWRT